MHFSKQDILTSKINRLNLINSITGIKPANLIGTISKDGHTNLAEVKYCSQRCRLNKHKSD